MDPKEYSIKGFGYCNLSLAALHSEPDHRSEMVSQVLFGETFSIIDQRKNWRLVSCSLDDYAGWIEAGQYEEITEAEYMRLLHGNTPVSSELVQVISDNTHNRFFPLLLGSSLPGIDEQSFRIGQTEYVFEGDIRQPGIVDLQAGLLQAAFLYLHSPYQWGGRSPFGIDCSGFVQMVFKLVGISLLRDTGQQVSLGDVVNLPSEVRAGDIAFFDNDEGQIIHTGIIIDSKHIIHSSGFVKVNRFDHFGIFNEKGKRYTHKLRVIKRIL